MQKLYRDSKGRFVSRESKVEELKGFIIALNDLAIYYNAPHPVFLKGHAPFFRWFRNQYKIYECF